MSGSLVHSVSIICSFTHQTSASRALLLFRCQGTFPHTGIPKRSKLLTAEFLSILPSPSYLKKQRGH